MGTGMGGGCEVVADVFLDQDDGVVPLGILVLLAFVEFGLGEEVLLLIKAEKLEIAH